MNNRITYIYTLSHPLTGEVRYVGKTVNPKYRLSCHLVDRSKTHKTYWIAKLKSENLQPKIDFIDHVEQHWQFWEQHYICLYRSWGFNLTNATDGGDGHTGAKASEITKTKMRESSPRYWLGKKRSEEDKAKFSKAQMGKMASDETKAKLSLLKTGSAHPMFGKHLTDEHKKKLWQNRSRAVSDEFRKKCSENAKAYWKKRREVACQIA